MAYRGPNDPPPQDDAPNVDASSGGRAAGGDFHEHRTRRNVHSVDNRGVSVGDGGVFVGRDVRGAEPCPVCETRLLTAGRTRCRQCQAKQEADAANARLVIFGVAALICLGMMLSFAEWLGIAAGAARLQFATMMTALLIGCATAVWIWFRQSRGPE